MPFCRRCGDIVHDPRCKCGGSAVSGVVKIARDKPKTPSPDRWSQTYTRSETTKKSLSKGSNPVASPNNAAPFSIDKDGARRVTALSTVGIYDTILSSRTRPPSPLKQSCFPESNDILPPPDRVQSPLDTTLANVFGSILQSPESLSKHACAICSDAFIPDATIYPDPSNPETTSRYLCKNCFILNGGSKGTCEACDNPVLSLKSEGEHVLHGGKYWHRSCFRCRGCMKDLGDNPMVDLLGTPCCADCFDTCLSRPLLPKASSIAIESRDSKSSKIGGLKGNSKEANIALQELTSRIRAGSDDEPVPPVSRPIGTSHSTFKSPPTTPSKSTQRSPTKSPRFSSPGAGSGPLARKGASNENYSPSTSTSSLPKQAERVTLDYKDEIPKPPLNSLDTALTGNSFDSRHRHLRDLTNEKNDLSLDTARKEIVTEIDTKPESQPWVQPRFGSMSTCPGCQQGVSPMERGVVQGPQGTRWHANCLVCGGSSASRKSGAPGCGKKLDSGAKSDREGKIWCRDCLSKLPRDLRPSPQVSPTKATFLSSNPTGSLFSRPPPINTQVQVTTLARQYTGGGDLSPTKLWQMSKTPTAGDEKDAILPPVSRHLTGGTSFLTQQLTGTTSQPRKAGESVFGRLGNADRTHQSGSLSRQNSSGGLHRRTQTLGSIIPPIKSLDVLTEEAEDDTRTAPRRERSLSPTRQPGNTSPTKASRPRPKSVLGMRSGGFQTGSDDRRGRGMFLVHQMTGSSTM